MKVKRLRVLPSVKLAGRVSGELHETLTAYREYYRHLHGEAIEPWPLVIQMLETFVDADREFHAWRRSSKDVPVGSAAGARAGAGKESRNG
jgi:hypothetical protein